MFTMDACIDPSEAHRLEDTSCWDEGTHTELLKLAGLTWMDGSFVDAKEEPAGYRWMEMAQEGHVVFRVLRGQSRFVCDIFSHNEFDYKPVEAFLRECFFVKTASTHWVRRVWS
jgi:hypothetical protein